jgi:hypothetical protein
VDGTDGAARRGLDGIDLGHDLVSGLHGLARQRLHLRGYDREAPAGRTGPRRLDGGVQRQEVRLVGHRLDQARDRADAVGHDRELLDFLVRGPRDLRHVRDELAGPLGLTGNVGDGGAELLGARRHREHVPRGCRRRGLRVGSLYARLLGDPVEGERGLAHAARLAFDLVLDLDQRVAELGDDLAEAPLAVDLQVAVLAGGGLGTALRQHAVGGMTGRFLGRGEGLGELAGGQHQGGGFRYEDQGVKDDAQVLGAVGEHGGRVEHVEREVVDGDDAGRHQDRGPAAPSGGDREGGEEHHVDVDLQVRAGGDEHQQADQHHQGG